jgi:HTH-type transcriptional regulator iscR
MKLTTRGRNAVTAMLDLCLHCKEGPVNLASIHERQNVSVHYLEQLFIKLRRAGLVNSIRGPGGGYVLRRDPATISIAEIVEAAEDNLHVTRCRGAADCQGGKPCIGHFLWHQMEELLENFLKNFTLYDVLHPNLKQPIPTQELKQVL